MTPPPLKDRVDVALGWWCGAALWVLLSLLVAHGLRPASVAVKAYNSRERAAASEPRRITREDAKAVGRWVFMTPEEREEWDEENARWARMTPEERAKWEENR